MNTNLLNVISVSPRHPTVYPIDPSVVAANGELRKNSSRKDFPFDSRTHSTFLRTSGPDVFFNRILARGVEHAVNRDNLCTACTDEHTRNRGP